MSYPKLFRYLVLNQSLEDSSLTVLLLKRIREKRKKRIIFLSYKPYQKKRLRKIKKQMYEMSLSN